MPVRYCPNETCRADQKYWRPQLIFNTKTFCIDAICSKCFQIYEHKNGVYTFCDVIKKPRRIVSYLCNRQIKFKIYCQECTKCRLFDGNHRKGIYLMCDHARPISAEGLQHLNWKNQKGKVIQPYGKPKKMTEQCARCGSWQMRWHARKKMKYCPICGHYSKVLGYESGDSKLLGGGEGWLDDRIVQKYKEFIEK